MQRKDLFAQKLSEWRKKMERQIQVEALQKSFSVNVKDAVRKKRNRTFSNATNCCGSVVKQKKFCSVCDGDVTGEDFARKIVKLGKAEHLINAQALKQVQEAIKEKDTIKIHTIVHELPVGISDRHDSYVFVTEAKKVGDFAELRELFRDFYGIGTASFGANEYEVVIWTGSDDRMRMNKLVEQGQLYDKPSADATGTYNEQIVEMERQILAKLAQSDYDFTQFRDTRAEAEEKMIEDVVLHGKQPEVAESVQAVVQKSDDEELERLKALMN
jgi:hypothetical protein